MRAARKIFARAWRVTLSLVIAATWLYSAWPQLFAFPPRVQEAKAGGWYDGAWKYRKKITIDTSKVPGSATSFPVLINRTDADWKFTDFGGHVETATGSEILFTAEDGTTKLDHETEKFASSTGALVRLGAVSVPVLHVHQRLLRLLRQCIAGGSAE